MLRRDICWGLPNRKTTPSSGILILKRAERFKNMMEGGCHIFGCTLPLPWQLLAYSGPWVWLFRSASAHCWWNTKDFLKPSPFRQLQQHPGQEEPSLQVLKVAHCSWEALGYPEPLFPASGVAQRVSLGAVVRRGPGTAGFLPFLRQYTGKILTRRDLGNMISHQHPPSTEQQGWVWDPFSWLNTHPTVQFNSFSCQFYSSLTSNSPEWSPRLTHWPKIVCANCVHSSLLFIVVKVLL